LAGCAREGYLQAGCQTVCRCLHGQAPRYLADHLITSSDVASRLRLQTLHSANRHQLTELIVIYMYLVVDSTHTAVGRFRSLVGRSGTRCLTSSEIRHVVLTVMNSFLRQLVCTNVTSELRGFLKYVLYKSTFYLLILVITMRGVVG